MSEEKPWSPEDIIATRREARRVLTMSDLGFTGREKRKSPEVPADVKAVLGDISEEQLRRLVVRLMPYIIDYLGAHAYDGAASVHLNHHWRESNAYLNERDKEND